LVVIDQILLFLEHLELQIVVVLQFLVSHSDVTDLRSVLFELTFALNRYELFLFQLFLLFQLRQLKSYIFIQFYFEKGEEIINGTSLRIRCRTIAGVSSKSFISILKVSCSDCSLSRNLDRRSSNLS
jgi:hypothetical protein